MKIKELRKKNNKTQHEIAEFLNTTQTTYSKYELGVHEPSIDTLCKLADYYGVSIDYLLGREGNEFSYLSEEEKLLIATFRKLNTYNQVKILGEVSGILIAQS